MKKILKTPITNEDLKDIKIGDVVYLDGYLVTCRDVAHRRLIEQGRKLPVDLDGLAIFHAGPIVRRKEGTEDKFEMVSIGPTTSMRMEKFEKEFIKETGVKLIIGKGGMGPNTMEACQEHKALEWTDLGMPETLWVCRVKEFSSLIISIDTHGNNIFEENKVIFNERKDSIVEELSKEVKFIK